MANYFIDKDLLARVFLYFNVKRPCTVEPTQNRELNMADSHSKSQSPSRDQAMRDVVDKDSDELSRALAIARRDAADAHRAAAEAQRVMERRRFEMRREMEERESRVRREVEDLFIVEKAYSAICGLIADLGR